MKIKQDGQGRKIPGGSRGGQWPGQDQSQVCTKQGAEQPILQAMRARQSDVSAEQTKALTSLLMNKTLRKWDRKEKREFEKLRNDATELKELEISEKKSLQKLSLN